MSAWGAIIMGFFGTVFAVLTAYRQWHVTTVALAPPLLVFAIIVLAAARVIQQPGQAPVPSQRVERAIMWSSIAEGVGLFLAGNIVINLHRPDLLLPAMSMVVGLHFLPIAIAARFRPFHLLGTAMILAAAIGFAVSAPIGGGIAGVTAAAGLWLAAGLAVRRDLRAKSASLAR